MVISGVDFLNPDGDDLIAWGANFRPITLDGQIWRLLTACFLHFGLEHLLFNMLALFFIVSQLELHLGKARFLFAYLLSGIVGSLCSLWWYEFGICAGASGAIFGMYGVFIALLTSNILEKSIRTKMLVSMIIFVLYSLSEGLKAYSGIDNAGHIGGLISGLGIGFAFVPSVRNTENTILKLATISVLIFIVSLSTIALFWVTPKPKNVEISIPLTEGYEEITEIFLEKMDDFFAMESMAMEFYNMPNNTPQHKIMKEIEERSMYYWDENIILLNSFNEDEMPAHLISVICKLKEYCNLRIKSVKIIYKGLEENTTKYQEQLERYYKKIEAISEEIRTEIYQ